MPLGTEVNVGSGDVALDGVAAHPKKGHGSHFSLYVYCSQTAGWMKTPLGTQVDLGPLKGHSSPLFRPMSVVAMSSILATAELWFTMTSYM